MYSKRTEKKGVKRLNAYYPPRESSLTFSIGFDKINLVQIISIFIISVLICSLIIQVSPQSEADPTAPQDLGVGNFKTTWTFNDLDDYNTTDSEINQSKASLSIHNFKWNQITKNDFNRATKDNVTVSEKSVLNIIWSDYLESSGKGTWTNGTISGDVDQWQKGSVDIIPKFIGAHNFGDYVWSTNLIGKYAEPGQPTDYYLKAEKIDLRNYEKIELSFWHYYIFDNATNINDGGIIEVSTDNGGTWEQISPAGAGYDGIIEDTANPLYNQDPPTGSFGGNSSNWVEARFDLSKYDGEENFTFRFRFATNGQDSDYGWYIDDILITSTSKTIAEVTLSPGNMVIGNEGVKIEQRPANITYIDTNNPASLNGVLTQWKVHIGNVSSNESKGAMRIYRNVGNKFVKKNETAKETLSNGENIFSCNIPVNAGDYIGWYSENADIFGKSGGFSYSIPGNVTEDHLITNWSASNYTYSIEASGSAVIPFGTLTSEIFDGGSSVIWEEINWNEDTSSSGTDIVIIARYGNPFKITEISWSEWSSPFDDPTGSELNFSNGQYFQYMVTFSTDKQPFTPILNRVSVVYKKYASSGEVETKDFVPSGVVQWLDFSKIEILSGQVISYFYSIDSGSTWRDIPAGGKLSSVSVLEGMIRFKMVLITEDVTVSPQINDISLTYSNARPDMTIFIETESDSAHPRDEIIIRLFYHNTGIGDATTINITLILDEDLIYQEDNEPDSDLFEEEGNAIRWEFDEDRSLTPGNRSINIDVKVKDFDRDATLVCYAILNYSDIGGNTYVGAESNTLTISVTPGLNILLVILLLSIIAIILVVLIIFLVKKRKESEEAKKISLDSVERGIGYLVIEDNPTKSYTLFSDLIDYGYSGLCITRTFPGRVKSTYSFEDVSLLWLSRSRDEDSILPTNLGAVLRSVKDFMEKSDNSVILLDGLEYMIVHNDFPKVLKLVHLLNEMAAINNAVLIMPLNPITLDEGKVALLKRDLKMLS